MEDLVQSGDSVSMASYSQTPLIAACLSRDLTMLQQLLDSGADVNLRALHGNSPLMVASSIQADRGVAIVRCLLRYGADCNIQNHDGNTALHMAVKSLNILVATDPSTADLSTILLRRPLVTAK